MPTHDEEPSFWHDWALLTPKQRKEFRKAVKKLNIDLVAKTGFRAGLRIKAVQGHPGVFEMTWAPDGRATFTYGAPVHAGEPHIRWRRVGTHDILKNP
ncbi:MAG: hypothetical protein OJF49_004686 [Ktedonobacterales bacterium]|jgi:hypothetical protein|nr:MAG: hypothetical protein OJF49_004686 [Ktedonobacterales bacterium]